MHSLKDIVPVLLTCYSPLATRYFLCNNNEITTNTVDPTSISVEIALTSGVTPNLIIE